MFGKNQLFAIAIGVILIVFVYLLVKKRPKIQLSDSGTQEIPPEEIETGMKDMAAQTVEFAKTHFNIILVTVKNPFKRWKKCMSKCIKR